MKKVTPTSARKSDHIRINLEERVSSSLTTGLENFHFIHQAVPEIDLEKIDLNTKIFQRHLDAPLLISSMTGGVEEARLINQNLAKAAQQTNIAIGVGSQRAAIEDPTLAASFKVRQFAPDILLFANLGAVQLNYGYSVDHCHRAIDMIEADGLILHLNPLQEAVQKEGDTNFTGLLKKIEAVCATLPVPVIAKEVGWGISAKAARQLADAGVQAIDVAGAGGTSWSQVEKHRAADEKQARLAAAFDAWGIPTAESIQQIKLIVPEMLVFASGGLRCGIDIAKCIALGASLGGMAAPFLKAAVKSTDLVVQTILEIKRELQVCMFAAGAADLDQLKNTPLINNNER